VLVGEEGEEGEELVGWLGGHCVGGLDWLLEWTSGDWALLFIVANRLIRRLVEWIA
jgi:hypothetical protein